MANMMQAAHEYATRPADERFGSIADLTADARADKTACAEANYRLGDMTAIVRSDVGLALRSPKSTARFTNWSFGQLSRTIGAPASYLRGLSPALTASCLNEGLSARAEQEARFLVRRPEATSADYPLIGTLAGAPAPHEEIHTLPTIRAATSDKYGRLWDADLYARIGDVLPSSFKLPPTWNGEAAGLYRGDRDSFLIEVDGGSVVEDPTLRGQSGGDSAKMFRGLIVRNSEVGAAAVSIETILFRYICGNHILWGASIDKSFRRRHVGRDVLRDTLRSIGQLSRRWADRPASADEAMIKAMAQYEIASTQAEMITELQKMGATKAQATAAYTATETHEQANPRSYWGAVQGLTRVSQDTAYQNERYELDRMAIAVMKRARTLVGAAVN